jgi:hypothetical protein
MDYNVPRFLRFQQVQSIYPRFVSKEEREKESEKKEATSEKETRKTKDTISNGSHT